MKLFISIVLILSFQIVNAKTLVISDIDDTIKISHLRSAFDMVLTAPTASPRFKGMSDLYQMINRQIDDVKFFYITDTPQFISAPHLRFLSRHPFPKGIAIFRIGESSEVNKFKRFSEVILAEKPERVILFGDNGQRDPKSFREVMDRFPHIEFIPFVRIAYPLPSQGLGALYEGETGFISAVEPAYVLMKKGVLTTRSVLKLSQKIVPELVKERAVRSIRKSWYIPVWQDCSGHSFEADTDHSSFIVLANFISQKCR